MLSWLRSLAACGWWESPARVRTRAAFGSPRGCRRAVLGWWSLGVLTTGGFEVHLLRQGRHEPGLPFGLAGQRRDAAFGWQVENGPQLHEPVQPIQAQRMLLPARAERSGEVPVARPVDLLHPGAQPRQCLIPCRSSEFPPARNRHGPVGVILPVTAAAGIGYGRDPRRERGDLLIETIESVEDRGLPGPRWRASRWCARRLRPGGG